MAWEQGEKEHVWFFWFSGVKVDAEGPVSAPLVEGTEWPPLADGEVGQFELKRRKLEVGMFEGEINDHVYWVRNRQAFPLKHHRHQITDIPNSSGYRN